jgi:hypothetical protein
LIIIIADPKQNHVASYRNSDWIKPERIIMVLMTKKDFSISW